MHDAGKPLLSSHLDTALSEGASVRLLAPQKHHDLLWALMAGLEDNFGAMVGANAYLTPSGEQVRGVSEKCAILGCSKGVSKYTSHL